MFQKEKWDLDKDGDKNGGNSRLGIIMLMLTLYDFQWQQATLPTTQGGLGLSCARDIAPAAYATSVLTTQVLKLRIPG